MLPISKERQILRSLFLKETRIFLDDHEFLEVDTPVLRPIPGMEPHLDPFLVHSPSFKEKGYLVTSPEYALKMALGTGLDKIYDIAHVFRSGEIGSAFHSPEFLMLEIYAGNWSLSKMTEFVISYFEHLVGKLPSSIGKIPTVQRKKLRELFQSYANCDWDRNSLEKAIRDKNLSYAPSQEGDLYEDLFFLVFLNLIEPHTKNGIWILEGYPPECASLAKVSDGEAERVEIYWNGVEIANGFFELTDPKEQRERFQKEREIRKSLGKEPFPLDEDFLSFLENGFLPPSSGISIGMDRLFGQILGEKDLRNSSPYWQPGL